MEKLNVFVSSTCYDLSQIRTNLYEHLESNGYTPMLSEYTNFPINPSEKTIGNCINAVKNNADIFVLIVGNRYGSMLDNGKSITNTEFLAAKSKGIPIYVFVDKRMMSILPVWKKNKDGDYTDIVDNTKIFEFISEVRDNEQLWVHEFESAQNIVTILKTQMSYLFKESLKLKSRFDAEFNDLFKNNLSNKAINILLEKEELYELNFFIQTLVDEIKQKESIKQDYEYRIFLDTNNSIRDDADLLGWFQDRSDTILNLIASLNNLINTAFPIYFGEPGVESDLKGLYYISQTYSRIFKKVIDWTIETSSTIVEEEREVIKSHLANLTRQLIKDIWNFPFEQRKYLDELILEDSIDNIAITFTINIDNDALDGFNNEFDKLKRELNR